MSQNIYYYSPPNSLYPQYPGGMHPQQQNPPDRYYVSPPVFVNQLPQLNTLLHTQSYPHNSVSHMSEHPTVNPGTNPTNPVDQTSEYQSRLFLSANMDEKRPTYMDRLPNREIPIGGCRTGSSKPHISVFDSRTPRPRRRASKPITEAQYPIKYPAHIVPEYMHRATSLPDGASVLPPRPENILMRRYATSVDERNFLTVLEYEVNGVTIIWDYYTGYVHLTGLWKAVGHSKADIVRLLDYSPELEPLIRRVRGGFLKIQGTWVPYEVARKLATRVCYYIRYALVPLFGVDFPEECMKPDRPGFGMLQMYYPSNAFLSRACTSSQKPRSQSVGGHPQSPQQQRQHYQQQHILNQELHQHRQRHQRTRSRHQQQQRPQPQQQQQQQPKPQQQQQPQLLQQQPQQQPQLQQQPQQQQPQPQHVKSHPSVSSDVLSVQKTSSDQHVQQIPHPVLPPPQSRPSQAQLQLPQLKSLLSLSEHLSPLPSPPAPQPVQPFLFSQFITSKNQPTIKLQPVKPEPQSEDPESCLSSPRSQDSPKPQDSPKQQEPDNLIQMLTASRRPTLTTILNT